MSSGLASGLDSLGLTLDAEAVSRLERYRDLIASGSARVSLTSVRDPAAIERRHILESLAFGRELESLGLLAAGAGVIDIGSGAGLPGLPLKLGWPSLRLTLLESVGKKCRFLRSAIAELGLSGIGVVEGRAEDAGRDPAHRAAYDLAVARAVAPLNVLLEYALPLLRLGGHFAGTKGSAAARELQQSATALRTLGGEVTVQRAFLPPEGAAQTLIVVRKTGPTPEAYPRRAGIPAKRPLA